ncbi:MAG: putative immunity protein [Candidatus Limnocylindrales bacterium]
MPNRRAEVELGVDDLREVARFAAQCAQDVLELFERVHPGDRRPREAIDAAWAFARGGRRGKALRDAAWAALGAAGEDERAFTGHAPGAGDAARAAMSAASAAYLHPLADAHQVKHILGAAAHAARASELAAGDDRTIGVGGVERALGHATPALVGVLRRYPAAPAGGGRVGELLRSLDEALRGRP